MHKYLILTITLAFTWSAQATSDVSCMNTVSETEIDQYVQCLEQKIEDQRQLIELYRNRIINGYKISDSNVINEIEIEIYGPRKTVTPIKGGLYRTTAYWSKGGDHIEISCIKDPVQPPDTERVGAKHTRSNKPYNHHGVGCEHGVFCDKGHQEYCISHWRNDGCYINKAWLDWYKKRIAALGKKVNVSEICAN